MEDVTVTVDPVSPEESRAPSAKRRAVPLWAALGATLAGVLLAFGIGYALNAEDAGAASERDELSETLTQIRGKHAAAEASLALSRAAVDECREALEEASRLATTAAAFTGDWQKLQALFIEWSATAPGSPEEADLDLQLTELSLQMDNKVCALEASADRVSSDGSCQET